MWGLCLDSFFCMWLSSVRTPFGEESISAPLCRLCPFAQDQPTVSLWLFPDFLFCPTDVFVCSLDSSTLCWVCGFVVGLEVRERQCPDFALNQCGAGSSGSFASSCTLRISWLTPRGFWVGLCWVYRSSWGERTLWQCWVFLFRNVEYPSIHLVLWFNSSEFHSFRHIDCVHNLFGFYLIILGGVLV